MPSKSWFEKAGGREMVAKAARRRVNPGATQDHQILRRVAGGVVLMVAYLWVHNRVRHRDHEHHVRPWRGHLVIGRCGARGQAADGRPVGEDSGGRGTRRRCCWLCQLPTRPAGPGRAHLGDPPACPGEATGRVRGRRARISRGVRGHCRSAERLLGCTQRSTRRQRRCDSLLDNRETGRTSLRTHGAPIPRTCSAADPGRSRGCTPCEDVPVAKLLAVGLVVAALRLVLIPLHRSWHPDQLHGR
jgi:hypothetical protein